MIDTIVEIIKEDYISLLISQEKLNRLEIYGVDNWGGYSYALSKNGDQNDFNDEVEIITKEVLEMDKIQY